MIRPAPFAGRRSGERAAYHQRQWPNGRDRSDPSRPSGGAFVRFLVGLLPNLLDCCRTSSAPGYHLGPRRTAAERAQYALIAGGIMLALSVLGLLWYRGEYQSEKAAGSPTAQPSRPRCPSSDHLRQVWP